MTTRPTVEPAGAQTLYVRDFPLDLKHVPANEQWYAVVLSREYDALRQQLAELRLRQCACSWSDDDERVVEMCNAHKEACEQQLAEMRAERDECFNMVCKLMPLDTPTEADMEWARAEIAKLGALAPTSQPSRGKCEQFCNCKEPAVYWEKEGAICGQCGLLLAGTSKPDCAQPEHGQTCISAGCTRQALPNALLCQEHGEALPPALRGEDCAQPERQVCKTCHGEKVLRAENIVTGARGETTCPDCFGAGSYPPSPPPTDDIVAGLRIVLNDYDLGEVTYRAHIERAIAALGEKGAK